MNNNYKLQKLAQALSQAQQTNNGQTCQTIIERFKKPTIDYNAVIKAGKPFTDTDFQLSVDGFYWPQFSSGWYEVKNKFSEGKTYDLVRARERLPKATLWGITDEPGPNDID